MHPAHRGYFWDTFKDHLKVLPVLLQDELLSQFVSRNTPEFAARVLSSPETALRWARQNDRGSRPDTRAAALRDPEIAARWTSLIDGQLRLDTFLAVKAHPAVYSAYVRSIQAKPFPHESEAQGMLEAIETWSEACFVIELCSKTRPDLSTQLLTHWVRHPQVAARAWTHQALLSPSTVESLRAECGGVDLAVALETLAYRDPWAAVAWDFHYHSDTSTLKGATAAAQNPNAAALYLRTFDTEPEETAVLVNSVLHAPESRPDPLTLELRNAWNEERGWKRERHVPPVTTPGRPGLQKRF
jgi:hypothetical protein